MDPRAMQQNVLAACDEVRGAFAVVSDRNHSVICPKPRRLAPLPPVVVPVRPVSRLPSYQSDLLDRCDTEAGSSLVGIFLPKVRFSVFLCKWEMDGDRENFPCCCCSSLYRWHTCVIFYLQGGRQDQNQVASSPSFFCGSPPSCVPNPVVLDSRFGEDHPPVPIMHLPVVQSTSPAPAWKGCASAKFSYKPAALRVEGFDCLNRDGRSCSSIKAMAWATAVYIYRHHMLLRDSFDWELPDDLSLTSTNEYN